MFHRTGVAGVEPFGRVGRGVNLDCSLLAAALPCPAVGAGNTYIVCISGQQQQVQQSRAYTAGVVCDKVAHLVHSDCAAHVILTTVVHGWLNAVAPELYMSHSVA
jgi:hypothetical protein